MKTSVRCLTCLIVFAVAILGGLACKGSRNAGDAYAWVTVDAAYAPKDAVEEFIKNDAEMRDALPVYIRNYGHDPKILARFKGKQFAKPNPNVLGMFFKGLDDWMIVDIKYKTETEREVQRTMLYVFENKQWKVGDTGELLK